MRFSGKLKLLFICSFLLCVFTTTPMPTAQAYYSSYGLGGLYGGLGSLGLYGGMYGSSYSGLYGSLYGGGLYGGLSSLYGGMYGLGLYGGGYGLGLYGGLSGQYGGISNLGLYGGGYGSGLYGGLSSLYGGLYGSSYSGLYGSLYGGGLYGGLSSLYGGMYGLGLYGGGYGSGLYGGLSSLTNLRIGLAEQAGLWQGIWSNGTFSGNITLNLVEDPVVGGILSGYIQLIGNTVLPTLVSVTGEIVNGQITLTGSNNLAGGKLVGIDIVATLTSSTEMDGEYTLTLINLTTVAETGAFKVTLSTPVI